MKRHLLLGFSLSVTLGLYAQNHYDFSTRSANYVEISSGSTVIENDDWGNTMSYTLAMPFNFKYFGEDVDSVYIYSDGFSFTANGTTMASPHGILGNVQARGAGFSPILYRLVGNAPERILQLQWQNFTFSQTIDLQLNEFANFQVWFYEGSGIIEFHNGSSYVSEASLDSFSFNPGLISNDGSRHIFLEGDEANPTTNFTDIWSNTNGLSAKPAVNSMYVFTPGWPSAAKEVIATALKIYPVPATSVLHVQSESALKNIRVSNSAGVAMFQTSPDTTHLSLDTHNWPSGVYFLQISTENGLLHHKVVKQ